MEGARVFVSDVPTYRKARGHGKETDTEIHLKVNAHNTISALMMVMMMMMMMMIIIIINI